MKPTLSIEEIIREFESFLNDKGLYLDFEEFIEAKGYKLSEFGMGEE